MDDRGSATADHGIPMGDHGIPMVYRGFAMAYHGNDMIIRGIAHGRSWHCYCIAMALLCMTMALPCTGIAMHCHGTSMVSPTRAVVRCPVQTPPSCHGNAVERLAAMPWQCLVA